MASADTGSDVKADKDADKNKPVYTVFSEKVIAAFDDDAPVSFEEALDKTGMGRFNYTLFVVCSVLLMAMALDIFGTSFAVTASACDLKLTTQSKGLIAALPMLGIIVSAHMWGYVADTRGRRSTLLLSMSGAFLFSLIGSMASRWPVFAVCKFFSAIFASASNAVSYALFGECTPHAHRNKLVLLMSSGLMFSQGLMSLIAYPILRLEFNRDVPWLGITYRPWRLLVQVYGLTALLGILTILLFVKESPKFYISRGREDESLKVLTEMFVINTGKKPEEYPVKSLHFLEDTNVNKDSHVLRSLWEQTAPLFRGQLLKKTLVIVYIVVVVYAVPPAFMMWMPTIASAYSRALDSGTGEGKTFCDLLRPQLNKDDGDTNFNSTIFQVTPCNDRVEDLTFITLLLFSSTVCIINICNSFLVRFLDKRTIVIGFHIVAGVCGLLLNFIHFPAISVVVFFAFQINLVCMGLTTGFTVEVYPTYLRAMAVCLTMMVGRGSSFLVITYVGILMEQYCDQAFYGFGAFVLSGAFVAMFLPRDLKSKHVVKEKAEA